MSEPKLTEGRWAAIYEAMTGATAPGHHHDTPVGTNPQAEKAGHEPDHFDARGIVMVPILVIFVTTLAYGLVTGIFSYINPGRVSPGTNPAGIAAAAEPFNERVNRISSTDPKAEFRQPRLEYVKTLNQKREGQDKPDPAFYRSFQPAVNNNTYEITPQDLYPSRFVDPLTGKRLLDEYEWVAKDKGVARIPVDEAMKLLAGKLPHKDGVAPAGTISKPKQSNGGQAIVPLPMPTAPAKDEHKH